MERTEEKTELDAMVFGTMIHAVLEEFSKDPRISKSTDPAVIREAVTGMLNDYFHNNYGNNRSFPILYSKTIALQRLQAFAERQAQSSSEGWEILECELACQLTIAGMQVRGQIDRIDKNRHDQRLRIIDYKTSGNAKNPAEQHISRSKSLEAFEAIPDYAKLPDGQKARWINLQLPLYWHMLKNHALGKACQDIELCYFNLPEAISSTGIEIWEHFTPETADAAYSTAENIIALIKQGIFWPPSDSVKYDDFEALFSEDMRDSFDGDRLEAFMKEHWRK